MSRVIITPNFAVLVSTKQEIKKGDRVYSINQKCITTATTEEKANAFNINPKLFAKVILKWEILQ